MKVRARQAWLLATVLWISVVQPADASSTQYLIHFNDELKISGDLLLTGTQSSSSVRFMCESGDKPVSGSTLHLFIGHSPDVDGNRSFLSVTLNYGVLRSIRLDEHNETETEIAIPLPPSMLKQENQISFSVEQFPAERTSRTVWTTIKPSSFITIQYEANPTKLDLSLLPSPLVDRHSYRPKQLSVLLPERPSTQTLEATARLIANYAAKLGEALIVHPVRSIGAAGEHSIIVGTPKEQPLRLFEDQLSLRFFRVFGKTRLGDEHGPFDANDGVVTLIQKPGKTFGPILLATGNSPDAVTRAVRKLIDGRFEPGSAFARVAQNVQMPAPLAPRKWKGFMPPNPHFTLAEMGVQEFKFSSQNDFSLSLELSATPDTQFSDYGQHMTLAFSFDSGVNTDNARLDVDLNGSALGRLPAGEASLESVKSFSLKIPGRRLRRQNTLKVTWRDLKSTSGKDPAAWLLPSSQFDLVRDYRSDLPDLGLLQYGLYPFGLRADLSDAMIVLPDDSDDEIAALFEFAGMLGRLAPTNRFAFGVRRRSELSRESAASSHIIELRIGKLPNGASSSGAVASVQESISPWNAEKYILSITASSQRALTTAIRTIFLEDSLKQFRGDTAYVYPNRVVSLRTAPARRVTEYAYLTHLHAWLRENWIALPLILVAMSSILFVGVKIALEQYKNRRAGSELHAFAFTSSSGPRNPL
jgi:hypothetical protein